MFELILFSPPYGDISLDIMGDTTSIVGARTAEGRKPSQRDFERAKEIEAFKNKLGKNYSNERGNIGGLQYD